MIALWIVLYLIVGGFVAGLIRNEDLDASAVFAWPIMLVFILAVYCFSVVRDLGYWFAEKFEDFIYGGKEK